MAENLGSATLKLSTDNRDLNTGMKNAEGSVNQSLNTLKGAALGVGLVAGGAALGFGAAMLKAGADTEAAFAEVRTLLPEISDEAFGALKSDVMDFSREMNVSTEETIPALYQAISAGVPAENVVSFLETASKAATGGVTDLETAVDGITSVTNAYGTEVLSAQEASDLMFTAVRLGKTDFEQLSNKLSNITPIASSLGVGFDEVAAAMATMTAQGVPTAEATTQLRQLLVEASTGGTDLSTAIADLTGSTLPELVEQGKPVHEILGDLRDSMPDQEFRDLFGSVEAMNAALLVTGPNSETMNANLAEMQTSAGATDKAFETMAATARFKVTRAVNWAKTTMAEWGDKVMPVLVSVVEDKLIPAFNSISDWVTNNKEAIVGVWSGIMEAAQALATWVTANIVPVIVEAFKAISTWVTNNKEGITGFFTALKTAATTLVDYFSASFGLVKTALQALFDAIAPQNVETGGIGSFFTNIVAWATAAVDWYSEYLGGITDAIQGITTWIQENPETISGWFDTAKAAVKTAIDLMKPIINGVITAVQEIVTWVQENPDTIQAWFNTAKTVLETTIGVITTVIGGVVSAVQAIVDWVKENPETISGWFETAKAALETTIGVIKTVIGGVTAAVQAIVAWVEANPETISGWFETAKTALETVVAAIGTVIGGVTAAVQAIAAWVQENPETISGWFNTAKTAIETAVNATTAIIAGITTAVKAVKTWLDENKEGITGFFTALKTAAEAVADFFETSWGAVTAVLSQLWNVGEDQEGQSAIERMLTGIVTWGQGVVDWLGSEEGGAAISAFFTNLVGSATAALEWFTENVGGITDSIAGITGFLTENPTAIQDWFSKAWTSVEATKTSIETGIAGLITKFGTITSWLTEHSTAIGDWFGNAWDVIKPMVENMVQAVGDLTTAWSAIQQWFIDLWNNVGLIFALAWTQITNLLFPTPSYGEQIEQAWGNIVDSIAGIFTRAGNAAIDVLNDLVSLMNTALRKWNDLSFGITGFSKTIPNPLGKDWTIGWGGITLDTPNIPLVTTLPKFQVVGAQVGGVFTQPTLTAVAEEGQPEGVFPLSRLSQFAGEAEAAAGGGKRDLHVHVENAYGIDNLMDQINEAWLDGRLRGLQDQLAGTG